MDDNPKDVSVILAGYLGSLINNQTNFRYPSELFAIRDSWYMPIFARDNF